MTAPAWLSLAVGIAGFTALAVIIWRNRCSRRQASERRLADDVETWLRDRTGAV